jgi:hypothetical protein
MKQTAVEWVFDELDEQVFRIDHLERRINISISFEDMMTLKKEAKEMEKEQSIEIPSDEEIEKILYYRSNAYYEGFYAAITMLRNKIKEGNI